MDSSREVTSLAQTNQEAANRAQIKAYRVGIIALIVTVIQAVAPYFIIWLNSERGTVMLTGWLPIILLLCSSALSATASIIVAARLFKTKRLEQEKDFLKSDLSEANSNSLRLKNELDAKTQALLNALNPPELITAQEAIERVGNQNDQLQVELHLAEKEVATLKGEKGRLIREKEKLSKDLANEKNLHESLKRSMDISRREVAETKAKADAQTSTYELTFKGMSQELNEAKLELEQAKLTINQETTQRKEFTRLYNEATHDLAIWKPIIKQAKDQAAQIDEWVRMKEAIPGALLLRDRMVTFEIRIRNESLYPISIRSKDIKGHLRFKAVRLREEIQILPDEPSIQDLEPKGIALIKLQQPLRGFEAETIQESREGADHNGLFGLDELYIPISAKNTPVLVRALPLVIIPEYIMLDVHTFSYDK